MRKVLLKDATQPELLAICRISLGMPKGDVPDNTGAEKLRGKIKTAVPGTDDDAEFIVPDDDSIRERAAAPSLGGIGVSARNTGQPTAVHGLYDPKVTINIFKNEINKGNPIPVAVNGRAMLIGVGKDQTIPYRYYLALVNAKGIVYEFDPNTNEVGPGSEENRHPFNMVSFPERSEIEAWDKALREESQAA